MNNLVYLLPVLLVIVVLLIIKQRGVATAEQVADALEKGARIIDVRTSGEYASRHLPKAVNIPLDELAARIAQHAPNREQPVLLHCASGVRSERGKAILQKLGYSQVMNLGSYGRAAKILKNL